MVDTQEKLSNQIKVTNIGGQVFASHSDAYDDLMARAVEKGASRKVKDELLALMETEQKAMDAAMSGKVETAKIDQSKLETTLVTEAAPAATDAKSPVGQVMSHQAFMKEYDDIYNKAHPEDREIADKNVIGTMQALKDKGAQPEVIAKIANQAIYAQGVQLKEQTANRKDNALTPSVNNYAPADDKTRVDGVAAIETSTGDINYNANINHGFDASALGLTRLAAQGSTSMNDKGELTAGSLGFTAVKALPESLQPKGATFFVAAGAAAKLTPEGTGGSANILAVVASEINGVPVGAYAGSVVDLPNGETSAVAHVEAMMNANTKHSTTFGFGGGHNFTTDGNSVGVSAYQKYNQFYAELTATAPVEQMENTIVSLRGGIEF